MDKPIENRDKILRAAVQVYGEAGFRGATTKRIAEAAGVNEITLFRQFGSKSALLHEAIQAAGLLPGSPELPSEPTDPRVDLLTWSRAYYENLIAKRALIRTCFGECAEFPDMIPPEDNIARHSQSKLRGYLERLQARGEARQDLDRPTAAAMLTGVLFADAMGRDIIPDLFHPNLETSIAHYVDLFLRAVLTPEAE